jgi:hypothetical protein
MSTNCLHHSIARQYPWPNYPAQHTEQHVALWLVSNAGVTPTFTHKHIKPYAAYQKNGMVVSTHVAMVHTAAANKAKKKAKGPAASGINPDGRHDGDQPPLAECITDVLPYGNDEANVTSPSGVNHSDNANMANTDTEFTMQHTEDSPTSPAPLQIQKDPFSKMEKVTLSMTISNTTYIRRRSVSVYRGVSTSGGGCKYYALQSGVQHTTLVY